jgi:hypothetical protein
MTQRVKIALCMGIVLMALLSGVSLARAESPAGGGDQCGKPLSERTGGWVCYEPDGR